MAGVPASSHGTAFNGGTITQPLTIAPSSPSAAPLTVEGPAGLIASGHDLVEVLDENSADRFQIFPDGGARVDQATGENTRLVAHAGDQVSVSDGLVAIAVSSTGHFRVTDGSSNVLLDILDPLKLGLYGHAAVVQQVVTSGTVTPEQLAIALQANGTLGGS